MKHMEVLRRKLVYELFIEQFLEMAQASIKYLAFQQTMGFLKQAERLCLLLNDDKYVDEAEKYISSVKTLGHTVETLIQNTVQGPELPRRESSVDKNAIAIRFRPKKTFESSYTKVNSLSNPDEVPSDDDNDEIYNYHKSVFAQIHSTSAENLARFQHTDECDDVEELTESMEHLEANLNEQHSDYDSDSATQA